MRGRPTLDAAFLSGVVDDVVRGAVFEVVNSACERLPRLQARLVVISVVRMCGFGKVGEYFSSAEGAVDAVSVDVFCRKSARLGCD